MQNSWEHPGNLSSFTKIPWGDACFLKLHLQKCLSVLSSDLLRSLHLSVLLLQQDLHWTPNFPPACHRDCGSFYFPQAPALTDYRTRVWGGAWGAGWWRHTLGWSHHPTLVWCTTFTHSISPNAPSVEPQENKKHPTQLKYSVLRILFHFIIYTTQRSSLRGF